MAFDFKKTFQIESICFIVIVVSVCGKMSTGVVEFAVEPSGVCLGQIK